jgi:hypothetical protein
MTSRKEDGGVHFYIGAIRVASVMYNRGFIGGVNLVCPGVNGSPHFANVSEAMIQMHKLLKSSPKQETKARKGQ